MKILSGDGTNVKRVRTNSECKVPFFAGLGIVLRDAESEMLHESSEEDEEFHSSHWFSRTCMATCREGAE